MTPSLGHEFNSWNGRKVTGQNFITEIRTTNRIILWPFGRLEVSDAGITLRAWPSVWLQPRWASWESIHSVTATRMWNVIAIGFKASDTSLAETTVYVSINYRRVIAELQGCGYTVDLQLDSMWKKARMSIKQRLFR